MLQPPKLQSEIWRTALVSQRIAVVQESPDVDLAQTFGELERVGMALPNLLLVDLAVEELNPYALCRWCRDRYPSIKVILTGGMQTEIPLSERRWATLQGADDLLPGFRPTKLLPSVVTSVRRVMEVLDERLALETSLLPALLALDIGTYRLPAEPPSSFNSLSFEPIAANAAPLAIVPSDMGAPSLGLSSATFRRGLVWGLLGLTLLLGGGLLWWLVTQIRVEFSPAIQTETPTRPAPPPAPTTFATVTGVPTGLFNYGGSTAWAPIRKLADARIQSNNPNLQLRYVDPIGEAPGSGAGIRLVLDGQLDFAQSSRPIRDAEFLAARQRGFMLIQQPVGIDGIAVVVHPSLPIPGLTLGQLQQIYRGEVTNWQQVGGPNRPIVPFSQRPKTSGTAQFLIDTVLQGKPFAPNIRYVYSPTDALRQLDRTPGGIYYASAPSVVPQCTVKPLLLGESLSQLAPPYIEPLVMPQACPQQRNQVNVPAFANGSYPLTRNLFVVIKQDGGRSQQMGQAYYQMLLSDEGQQLLEEAGFVPLK